MKATRENLEAARAAITRGIELMTADKYAAADVKFAVARNLILNAERDLQELETQLRKLIGDKS